MTVSLRQISAVLALLVLLAPAARPWCAPAAQPNCASGSGGHACCDVDRLAPCDCPNADASDVELVQRLPNGAPAGASLAVPASAQILTAPARRHLALSTDPPPRATGERLSLLAILVV